MRAKYGTFQHRLTRLVSGTINEEELEELKEFIDDCYPELSPKLTEATSVKGVMNIIKSKCNVINIAPVEDVVSFHSITKAEPLITDYNKSVNEFCHNLKIEFSLEKKLSTSDFLICLVLLMIQQNKPIHQFHVYFYIGKQTLNWYFIVEQFKVQAIGKLHGFKIDWTVYCFHNRVSASGYSGIIIIVFTK